MDHMTVSLRDFAAEIVEDGIVDEEEVQKIKERIYADGIIDREEADFLFEINDGVSGNANHPTYNTLFVEALATHVLEDDTSPGEVDEDEAKWLISKIQGDGQVDANEKALLENIKANAKNISAELNSFISTVI